MTDDDDDDRGARAGLRGPLQRSSWFLRWLAGAPARWLGKDSSVGQDLIGGTTDGLSYLRHLARGNRIRRQASFEGGTVDAPPVLLIHGFLGTRGSMYLLERRLVEDGFVVVSFNIGALNSRDIRRSAFMIHRKIERILAHTPAQKIDIVGHSMGGLIGLYLVKKLGGHARVRRLVMMGTPVRGTWVALAGIATLGLWSTSSWQLLPRSRFLDELAQARCPPAPRSTRWRRRATGWCPWPAPGCPAPPRWSRRSGTRPWSSPRTSIAAWWRSCVHQPPTMLYAPLRHLPTMMATAGAMVRPTRSTSRPRANESIEDAAAP
ncbi:MAG: alpha/beta fold hydrolase [Kofleriaceae bacterium]